MESCVMYRKYNGGRSSPVKGMNETMRILITVCFGIVIGFCLGVSIPSYSPTKFNIESSVIHDVTKIGNESIENSTLSSTNITSVEDEEKVMDNNAVETNATTEPKIWVASNPKGAESLPLGIVASESDFYLRRLWGLPDEDLTSKPKYLVAFAVGYDQRYNIDKTLKKFSDNFSIILFHYDGRASEWEEFEWSKRAIHVSALKQTKWWFAKRILHPDVVAAYDYIFIWDEDLGVEHFDAEKYIELVRKYNLEISQPALDASKGATWLMTKRKVDLEVHKETEERPGWCHSHLLPPCAAFVEIMAPVFSRDAWRCVWHLIQNDLVHGWGLDFALQRCVELPHEQIGVVDDQWIVHQGVPSLGNQGQAMGGDAPWKGVRQRCRDEWAMFRTRMENAERDYFRSIGVDVDDHVT